MIWILCLYHLIFRSSFNMNKSMNKKIDQGLMLFCMEYIPLDVCTIDYRIFKLNSKDYIKKRLPTYFLKGSLTFVPTFFVRGAKLEVFKKMMNCNNFIFVSYSLTHYKNLWFALFSSITKIYNTQSPITNIYSSVLTYYRVRHL